MKLNSWYFYLEIPTKNHSWFDFCFRNFKHFNFNSSTYSCVLHLCRETVQKYLGLRWSTFVGRFSKHSAFHLFNFFDQSQSRVARWYNFKPKIPIWVNFVGSWNGKCWNILRPIWKICGNLIHFMVTMYILSFSPFLYVIHKKKNLAILYQSPWLLLL
jgi:hypothetical protein